MYKISALMVHWHPVPVANQLLILIIKLASYILTSYNIRYSYYSLSKLNVCEMFGKFVKFTAEMFSECQNADRVKTPAKNTDVCMFCTFICPEYM